MKIVYYRKIADRKIFKHHELDPSIPKEEIPKRLYDYNSAAGRDDQAFVADVEPDSLIEYLVEKAKGRMLCNKRSIDNALEALDDARSAIEVLKCGLN